MSELTNNYRTFNVRANKDTGAVRGILTTEQPVTMFDWERFEFVPEVLLMSGMKARGETVKLLDTHDTGSVSSVLGSYKNIRVHKAGDRADFDFVDGELEFSSVEQDVATKVREGHINEMSVGYQTSSSGTIYVGDGATLEHEGKTYEGPLNLRTEWRLNEASVVPLGADDQAQIKGFRSMQDALKHRGKQPDKPEPESGEGGGDAPGATPATEGSGAHEGEGQTGLRNQTPPKKTMSDENNEPAPLSAEERAKIVSEGATAERQRQAGLNNFESFARGAGLSAEEAKKFTDEFRNSDKDDNDAYRALAKHERFNGAPANQPEAHDPLGLDEKEKRSYSIASAVSQIVEHGRLDPKSLEGRVSEAIAQRTGRTPDGFFAAGARDLTAGTATDGAEIVDDELRSGDFIDVLRPNMVSRQLGIRVLNGLKSDVSIPRKTSASAASWVGDESTTAHSESEPQFDQVQLTPNHLGCFTDISKQLLHQGTPDAEALVRDDLNQAISVALDAAVFKGTGSAQPQGVIGATGVQTSTIASAGSPTLAELVEFESDVDTGNALMGSLQWVTTPAVRGYLRQTLLTSGVSGYMWENNQILGYNAHSTSQLAANTIIFGNWNDYILGVFDGVDIVVDPYGDNAKKRLVTLTVNLMADGDVRHGASFCTNA